MTLSSSCHVRFLICVLSTLAYVGLSNSQNFQADLQNNTLVITVSESLLPNREISTLINSSCQIAESLKTAYKFDLIRWIIIRNSTTVRTVDISTISCRRETSTQSFTIADTVTVKAVVTEPTPQLPTTRTIRTSTETDTSHHVIDNRTHSSLPTTSAQATNKDATATASFYPTTSEISATPNYGSNSVSTSKIVTDAADSVASTQDASVETTSSNLVPTGVTHSEPEPTTPRSTLISTNKTSTASQTPITGTILDNDTLTSKTITTESASAPYSNEMTTKEVTPTTKAIGFTDTSAYVAEISSATSSYVEPSSKSATTTISNVISDSNLTTALIASTNTTELITVTDIATTPTRTFSGTQTSGLNISTISKGVSDSATTIYETTTASTTTSDATDLSAQTNSISVATLNTTETEPTATLESIASTTSDQIAKEIITSESVPVTESTLRSDVYNTGVSTGTETGITRTAFSTSEPTHNADTSTVTSSTSTTDTPTGNGTISTEFSTTDTTSGPAVSISSDRNTTSGSTASPTTTTSPEVTGLYTGTMSIITSSNGSGSETTVGSVRVDSGIVSTDPTTKISSIATTHSEANSMTVSATPFDVSDDSVHTTYPTATPTPGYASESTTNLNTGTNIFETSSTAHTYTSSADSSVASTTSGTVTEVISSEKPHVTQFESTVASTLSYSSERTESDEPNTAIATGFTTEASSTVQTSGAFTHSTTLTESSTTSPTTEGVSISTSSTVSSSVTTTHTVPTKTSTLVTSSVPLHPESSFDSTTEVTMLTTSTEIPAAGAGADFQGTGRSISSGEIVAAVLGSLFGTFVIVIAIFFIARQIRRRTSSTRELMNPYGPSNLYNTEIYQPQRPTL